MERIKIFISSVQAEFAEERAMLSNYIRSDALLGKFFESFVFEEQPASCQSPSQLYLDAVEQSDVYLCLIGNIYGNEDSEGISPTEREYDKAVSSHLPCLVFVKSVGENERQSKETVFLQKIEQKVVRRTFVDTDGLRTSVYASLVRMLEQKSIIRWKPFDASCDNNADFSEIDEDKIKNFVHSAREKRNFPLNETTAPKTILKHLDLIEDDGRLTNAAILLFGRKPQKFFITSEVKCAHFYGTKVEKPVPSLQIYKGDLFQLVDDATSFVMSRINVWTGTRSQGTQSELPYNAVKEAICNAICHRDYTSNASVQVMLFKDRLEVWNPGNLPYGLTVEKLSMPHKSMPANPLIAEPMYLCGLIEKLGTGTEDILSECMRYGLSKPEFHQDNDFRTVIWRATGATGEVTGEVAGEVAGEVTGENSCVRKLLAILADDELSKKEMMAKLGLKGEDNFRENYLKPALILKVVEMTNPKKKNSPNQKYRRVRQ